MELAKSRLLSPEEHCISLCVREVPVRTSSPMAAAGVESKATGVAAASPLQWALKTPLRCRTPLLCHLCVITFLDSHANKTKELYNSEGDTRDA